MSIKQILIQAKALIDTPEKWTQDSYARNAEGRSISSRSAEAVCFCSLGALNHLELNNSMLHAVAEHLANTFNTSVPDFNDRHTHAEVMEAWDRAIATAPD